MFPIVYCVIFDRFLRYVLFSLMVLTFKNIIFKNNVHILQYVAVYNV